MKHPEPDVRIEFAPSPAAAGAARRAVARQLPVSDGLGENVELVVSELVTNVVRHARTDGVVELWACGDEVRIEVHDADSTAPHIRGDVGPDGGFGLRVVERLSTEWGHRRRHGGKTVWAVVTASPSATR